MKTKELKLEGFLNIESAQKQAKLERSKGNRAFIVNGTPINTYLGIMDTWNVIIITNK